jgi:cellulose synthase (UDP-forming)
VRLSWRAAILEVIRWPVVIWALLNVLLAVKRPYMITPKGTGGFLGLGWASVYGPYLGLTALQVLAVWLFVPAAAAGVHGYYGLVLLNAAIGAAVIMTVVVLEIRQLTAESGVLAALRARVGALGCALGLAAAVGGSALAVWEPMAAAIT